MPKFAIDGCSEYGVFYGIDTGKRWNGFDVPAFSLETLKELALEVEIDGSGTEVLARIDDTEEWEVLEETQKGFYSVWPFGFCFVNLEKITEI